MRRIRESRLLGAGRYDALPQVGGAEVEAAEQVELPANAAKLLQEAAPSQAVAPSPAVAPSLTSESLEQAAESPKRRITPSTVVGAIILAAILAIGLVGPLVYTVDPNVQSVYERVTAPGWEFPFGSDNYGRDVLARMMAGARVSLFVGFAVVACSSILGFAIGLFSAWNRVLDYILMRICDGLMSIPGFLLAIALMAMLGASINNVVIALTIVFTPSLARIVRSRALVLMESPFVDALKLQGASAMRILWLHIAPNVMGPFLVQAAFVFAEAILAEATLSFLGLGIAPPDASWGNILQEGKALMSQAWWMVVIPAGFVVGTVLSLNLIGDGLRDMLDPKSMKV